MVTLAIVLSGCGSGADADTRSADYALSLDESGAELVYEETKERGIGSEEYLLTNGQGQISPDQWQRIARPYSYLGTDEEWVYDEDAWASFDENGVAEKGYRVLRRPNTNPVVPQPDTRAADLSEDLKEQLATAPPSELLKVVVEVRGFPDWDIPILPRPGLVSSQEFARLQAEQDDAVSARKSRMSGAALPIRQHIYDRGGTVVREAWTVGTVVAKLRAEEVRSLLALDAVVRVSASLLPEDSAAGEFYVGDHDTDARTDVEDFLYSGYSGAQSNSARHGFTDMLAAVLEPDYFEDEACFYQSAPNNCGNHATDRIVARFDCDDDAAPECDSVSNFTTTQESMGVSANAIHGTAVSGIIVGDYKLGQGDGVELDDPAWTSGAHSYTWERTSSGVAPDANVMLLGGRFQCSDCSQSGFATVADWKADVMNNSWAANFSCDEASSADFEDELENAYDQGVFVVACAGNNGTGGSCNVASPADTPKAFAVNGLATDAAACEADYDDCVTHNLATRGGDTVTVNGVARSASFIDLTAPGELYRYTGWNSTTAYGGVREASIAGTSIAAPVVAGAALVLKDFMLSDGWTFINNPGRLHAMMLAMGDRWHDDAGYRKTTGMDELSGAGRLRMRLFDPSATASNRVTDPWSWRLRTYTFTSSGTTSFLLNTSPMGSGTALAKCAMWEGEDMSAKSDVSDVYLSINVRQPVSGVCSHAGTLVNSTVDNSWDIRHIASTSASLSGNCLEVNLHRGHITGLGSTVNVFCYSAGEQDYAN